MTEDEVMRLLERADPVLGVTPDPPIDAVAFLDALRVSNTTVALTDTGTRPAEPEHRHRWPIIIVVAAAVVAIVVGGLVLAARDLTSGTHTPAAPPTTGPSATVPAPTITATPAEVTAAERTARGFMDAGNTYDADRVLSYFRHELQNPEELRLGLSWRQAVGHQTVNIGCAAHDESVTGIVIRCTYDYHSLRSEEAGLGPYTGSYIDVTVRDGEIEHADLHEQDDGFSAQIGEPFRRWVSATHPDDVALMYDGSELLISEESIPLWEQRTREFVATGGPTTISNGWVAFAAGSPNSDIYLVREGSPAHRIAGSDTDGIDQVCPAFSPDATRILYGEASGNEEAGYSDPVLVISDLAADGVPSATTTIPLDGTSVLPCATWSADGRWVAFGAGDLDRAADPSYVDAVWVVDTETDDIRRLTGLTATDLEWAPDATDLFIASDGTIAVYSVDTGQTRPLGGTSGVRSFTISPDGQRIAFERLDPEPPAITSPQAWPLDVDLWLMDADGTGERVLAADFAVNHGVGPVWSPDGGHIVYQRQCEYTPTASGVCREGHEVAVVSVTEDDPTEPVGTQLIIPPPETIGASGPVQWYPFSVTWSPDGTTLLYLAWGLPADGPETPAVITVRPDGETPPAFLDDDLGASVYGGHPWQSSQTWGRRPG